MHKKQSGGWPYSKVEALQRQRIFMQLSFVLSFEDRSDHKHQVLSMCKCHKRVSFRLKIVVYNCNSYTVGRLQVEMPVCSMLCVLYKSPVSHFFLWLLHTLLHC